MLLDTHTLIWFLGDDARLTPNLKQRIEQASHVYVSIVSIWEIAIKIGVGKLTVDFEFQELQKILVQLDMQVLQITFTDTEVYINLPLHHRDLFDRMLIAQAIHLNLAIAGCDTAFDAYPVKRIWEKIE